MSTNKQATNQSSHTDNKGEGDKDADRRYRENARDFVKEGRVDDAAEKAKKQDKAEGEAAEQAGKSRAKEFDPEVHRNYEDPVDEDKK